MFGSTWRMQVSGVLLAFGVLAANGLADDLTPRISSLADLKRCNAAQLRHLYAHARPGTQPAGFLRGQLLVLENTIFPRAQCQFVRLLWKGKVFDDQQGFVNQWTLGRVISSRVVQGPSYFDGRPCMILEYADGIPFFGNMRDEIREVAPGVYLAMVFERNEPHTFRGYIGLEQAPTNALRAAPFLPLAPK